MAQAKEVDTEQKSKEATFLDHAAMKEHMEELCSANDAEKKDVCVLINLCDIDPAHQLFHERTVNTDPSAISDPESLILKVSNAYQFKAYKLSHGVIAHGVKYRYGVIAHGNEDSVEKKFACHLQSQIDTPFFAKVQFAASFGITARVKGDDRLAWYSRARQALNEATELRKKYNLTSQQYGHHERQQLVKNFIVTHYGKAVDDDEKKQHSMFPDDISMIPLMEGICKTNSFEKKAVFVLMEISITKGAADYKFIEDILGVFKKRRKYEVFHDAVWVPRRYGLIIDDAAGVLEIAEFFENKDSYQVSFGIARRAKNDNAIEWFNRAVESIDLKSDDERPKAKIGATKKGTELFLALPKAESKSSDGD